MRGRKLNDRAYVVVTGIGFLCNMGIDVVQTLRGHEPEEGLAKKQLVKNLPSALIDGAVAASVAFVGVTAWPAVGLSVVGRVGIGMLTGY